MRSPRPPATATRAQPAQKHRQTRRQPRLPEDSAPGLHRPPLPAPGAGERGGQQSPAAARHLRTGCNAQAEEKPTVTTLNAPRLVAPLPDPGLHPRGGGCNPLACRALPPVWPRSRTNRTQSRSQAPRAPLIAVAALDSVILSRLQLSPKCTERGKAEPPEPLAARDSPSSSALPQRAATPLPPPARVALPPAAWCPGLSGSTDPGVTAPSETWSTHSPSVLDPLPPGTLPPPVVLQPQAARWSRRCCRRFVKPGATRAFGTGQPPGRCSLDNKGQPQGSPLPSAPTRSGAERLYSAGSGSVWTTGRKD